MVEIEHEKDNTRGIAIGGLTTGIIGTALNLLGGGAGNILGGGCNCSNGSPYVNRYEAEQAARIAELETEVKLRDANTFALGELNKMRNYVDAKFDAVNAQLCSQAVYNATNTATLNCMQGQIATLMNLTKVVVPNSSICPGWGNVTVAPATTTAG